MERNAVIVYLDVFLLENIVMDYLILWVTARFCKARTNNLRLFLGAFAGSLYLLLYFLPRANIYHTAAAKIILSLLIVAIAFSPEKLKSFLKVLAAFYGVSFVFAGAFIAITILMEGEVTFKNGMLFLYDLKSSYLMLACGILFIILKAVWSLIQGRLVKERLLVPVNIRFDSQNVTLFALIDTGNALQDPISKFPVIVVEYRVLKDVLPEEVKTIFVSSRENDLSFVTSILSNSQWVSRFRLIPYTSLGKENGMLIGFKPDLIEIGEKDEKKGVADVIVGIYSKRLSRDEHYNALLNPELME